MAHETPPGISYRRDLGAWWPDYDHDPVKCKSFVDHGLPAIDSALRYVRTNARECVQAGGHAGFWPLELSKSFTRVHTFEPEPLLYECMRRNCHAQNVTMYRHGLGAAIGPARFKSHCSAGSWRVDPEGEHRINLLTVDSLQIKHCDALFLDIEGYEVPALEGAAETIRRCRPVILVELLPRSREQIELWLRLANYKQVDRFGRDGIYCFRGQS